MKTKTYPALVKNLRFDKLNGVICHEPTESNPIGQSGIHTFVDDVIDIVLNSENETHAWRNLHDYLMKGEIELI